MRTFHTGGVAGLDITAGLPRVEELFEARIPKGKAEISQIDGDRRDHPRRRPARRSRSSRREVYDTSLGLPKGAELLVAAGRPGRRSARSWPASRRDGASTMSRAPVKGFLGQGRRRSRRPRRGRRRARVRHPAQRQAARRERPGDPRRRRRSPTARSTRRSSSRPGAGTRSSATWSTKSRRSTAARA